MQNRIPGDLAKKLANILVCTTETELQSTIASINEHTKRAYFSFLINLNTFFNALETAALDRYLDQLKLAKETSKSNELTLINNMIPIIEKIRIEKIRIKSIERSKYIQENINDIRPNLNSEKSCNDFFLTLTQELPIELLHQTVTTLKLNATEKNQFKRKLCSYMVNNTQAIVTAQTKLASLSQQDMTPEAQAYTDLITQNTVAKNVLLTIKDLILSTDWNVGLLGGTPAPGRPDKKIPHRMATILSIIAKHEAQSVKIGSHVMIWKGACKLVADAAHEAINNEGLSFFSLGKRSQDTKQHYQQFVRLIKAG